MLSRSIALESASNLDSWYERMEAAERGDGWLAWCRDRNLYVVCSDELVDALTKVLGRFTGSILEIGAGSGELAIELRRRGVPVTATDVAPGDSRVIALKAREALDLYKPLTVISSFLPVDAAIEAEVFRSSSARQYLYIGPMIMGRVGPEALWSAGWAAAPLPEVDAALISRLDVLPDFTRRTHQRGAGAVLLEQMS